MRTNCKIKQRPGRAIALLLTVAMMLSAFASPVAIQAGEIADGSTIASPSDYYIQYEADSTATYEAPKPEDMPDVVDTDDNATPSDMIPPPAPPPGTGQDAGTQIGIVPLSLSGTFNLTTGEGTGDGWIFANNVLTILDGADVEITGTATGGRRIEAYGLASPSDITLSSVIITGLAAGQSPISIHAGGTLNITVEGVNNITGNAAAGIHVREGTTLNIGGSGTLTVTGGAQGAGIGGNLGTEGGTIQIGGNVTVTATGGAQGAGIGGGGVTTSGTAGAGGTVRIGGNVTVTATGGAQGAGIGGGGATSSIGGAGAGGTVHIDGYANVTARGMGTGAAGIGGGGLTTGTGSGGAGGTVNIGGEAVVEATGATQGAGIGGGGTASWNGIAGAGGEVTIGGEAEVTATGGTNAAGIGGGGTTTAAAVGAGGIVVIEGDATVTANRGGTTGARSIGAGGNNTIGVHGAAGEITIRGNASVTVNAPGDRDFVWIEDEGQPESREFNIGAISGYLEVDVTTEIANPISYQWRRFIDANSTIMPGETSSTLEIPDDLAVGTHLFYVRMTVANLGGFVFDSDVATVEVIDPAAPRIRSIVIDGPDETLPGGTHTFSATVGGDNLLPEHETVTWSVDGSAGTTIGETTGILTVSETETAATLTVTATSTLNTDFYRYVEVTVLPLVTGVTVTPEEVTVFAGATMQFNATVEGPNLEPEHQAVTWDVEGASSTGTTIDVDGLLTVAANETAEVFIVRATSVLDDTESGTADVFLSPFSGTFNLATGTGTGEGWTWTPALNTLTIHDGANVEITGNFPTTTNRRIVISNAASITLRNVGISALGAGLSPITINPGGSLNLTIEGANTLTGGGTAAGILAPAGTTLNIGGSGTLTSSGGTQGAGIGGNPGMEGGSIRIGGNVTVTATGGTQGAGIGGGGVTTAGTAGAGGEITITDDATVTATGGTNAAGIGGGGATTGTGGAGAGGTVTIDGYAIVTAAGMGTGGAGIGGGGLTTGAGGAGAGGTVTIGGEAVVNATGATSQGAGIGGGGATTSAGGAGAGGTVNIGGEAEVTATGGTNAAGIGGGGMTTSTAIGGGAGGIVVIEGYATVTANRGGFNAARSIGAGGNNAFAAHGAAGEITIHSNASVTVNAIGDIDFVWIDTQPEDMVLDEGIIDGELEVVTGSLIANTIHYQWREVHGVNRVVIHGANSSTFEIPDNLPDGTHYFDVQITVPTVAGFVTLTSDVVEVVIYNPYAPRVDRVTVTAPATPSELRPGESYQFSAAVTGANLEPEHHAVTWTVTGRRNEGTTINQNGLLTVNENETAAMLTIRATSVFDETVYGTVNVLMYPFTGMFNLATGEGEGAGWHYNVRTNILSILYGANVYITGTAPVNTGRRVVINGDSSIALDNVRIESLGTGMPPISLTEGVSLNVTLVGHNHLAAGFEAAGIQVPYGTTLNIGGDGSATVTGGTNAAGIGGGPHIGGGTIIIGDDVTITAQGGGLGAGIGGGNNGAGSVIIITDDAAVTATGGTSSAGIGGGSGGAGGEITISGNAQVTARGNTATTGTHGAGIGGGANGAGGIITITDEATVMATGGLSGAGIGGGNNGAGGTITIEREAAVTATGGSSASGIGGGANGAGGTITITDEAAVTATGGSGGAGIGGGTGGNSGTINIDGDTTVRATGNGSGAGIGGGAGASAVSITIGGDATVTAQGGTQAAGIGGGSWGGGGEIVIEGNATVEARSGIRAAGIGGGQSGAGGNITIRDNAEVLAVGSIHAAAIGGGSATETSTGGAGGTISIEGNAYVNAYSIDGIGRSIGAGTTPRNRLGAPAEIYVSRDATLYINAPGDIDFVWIVTQPQHTLFTPGGYLEVTIDSLIANPIRFEWHSVEAFGHANSTPISEITDTGRFYPTNLAHGNHLFFAEIIIDSARAIEVRSDVVVVTVNDGVQPVPPAVVTGIEVTPNTAAVPRNYGQQFNTVATEVHLGTERTRTVATAVNWTVEGTSSVNTTITEGGLLTVAANEAALDFTIVAALADNEQVYGTAAVTVPRVFIIPASPTVNVSRITGGSIQLGTNVIGLAPGVTWTVTGGRTDESATITAGGLLRVTPDETASTLTVRATSTDDGRVFGTATVTINRFTPPTAPRIQTGALPGGYIGEAYTHRLFALGYPAVSWSNIGNLPPGLSLDQFGFIRGTPTQIGEFTFFVLAHNGVLPNDMVQMSITISEHRPVVTVVNTFAEPGGTAYVHIRMDNNPGFAAMMMRLSFSPYLTLDVGNFDINDNVPIHARPHFHGPISIGDGDYYIGWSGRPTDLTVDGVLLTLNFIVSPNAPRDALLPVEITFESHYGDDIPTNAAGRELAIRAVPGEVSTHGFMLGDANADGRVTSADGTVMARHFANHGVVIDLRAADLNGDGHVEGADLILLVQRLMGR